MEHKLKEHMERIIDATLGADIHFSLIIYRSKKRSDRKYYELMYIDRRFNKVRQRTMVRWWEQHHQIQELHPYKKLTPFDAQKLLMTHYPLRIREPI